MRGGFVFATITTMELTSAITRIPPDGNTSSLSIGMARNAGAPRPMLTAMPISQSLTHYPWEGQYVNLLPDGLPPLEPLIRKALCLEDETVSLLGRAVVVVTSNQKI